jgi:hypothetical protein
VATGARVDGDIARHGELQAAIFGAHENVRRFGGAQPSSLNQSRHYVFHGRMASQIRNR